uniref:Uncharacterized protein n=1 Tax=Plectus sambesii TaxID=2011161 RepID=A0A914WG25_9BILA
MTSHRSTHRRRQRRATCLAPSTLFVCPDSLRLIEEGPNVGEPSHSRQNTHFPANKIALFMLLLKGRAQDKHVVRKPIAAAAAAGGGQHQQERTPTGANTNRSEHRQQNCDERRRDRLPPFATHISRSINEGIKRTDNAPPRFASSHQSTLQHRRAKNAALKNR